MGILDEAIREHLELKRQHGAGDSELRELEDEAFGPPARPGAPGEASAAEAATTIAPAEPPEPAEQPAPEHVEEPALPPEAGETLEPVDEQVEPSIEEHPAMEHQSVDPDADAGTVAAETEEHPPPEPPEEPEVAEEPFEAAISDQPTELHDFGGEPAAEDAPGAVEEAGAEEEEVVEDEFFSEQSLSDELDQALDAPATEQAAPAPDLPEPSEPESGEEPPPAGDGEDFSEGEAEEDEGEDVLEETPEFLQDTPEHDRLWFEQKPPKDFDFDD